MTPLTVFFRTLSRTTAIFLGTALVFLHPPLEWGRSQSVTATKGPRQMTIDGLSLALRDPDAGVRRAVARALDAYAAIDAQRAAVADLTKELSSTDAATRARAACGLRDLGGEAVAAIDTLVATLADNAPVPASVCDEGRRRNAWDRPTMPGEQAAAALTEFGDRAIEPLMKTLKHTAPTARRNAAWALGALDAQRAVTALSAALKDVDAGVREQAAWALGAIGEESAVPALIDSLKDSEPKVREQAAWALGAIGDNRAMDALLPLLKDPEAKVRRQAAWAIGVVTK